MNAQPDHLEFDHLHTVSIAAEQSLIGTCIMAPQALAAVSGLIDAGHMFEKVHQTLWRTMIDLASEGRPITPATLVARLGNPEINPGMKLSTYIARCCSETTCPAAYAPDYARQVRESWSLRTVAECAEDARAAALNPGTPARSLISSLMHRLDEARSIVDGRAHGARAVEAVTSAVIDRMSLIMTGEQPDNLVRTGLRDLDRKIGGGFKPGDLVIIAGRPGMGKTTLGVSIARQSARLGHAGGFFSLEMPEDQIGCRFIADEAFSGQDSMVSTHILQGQLNDFRAQHAIDAARALRGLPLAVDDSSSMTVGELGARTRSLSERYARAGKKLDFIVIDYLKFLRSSDRYRGQRVLEVGEITGGLKALAKDLGIAVVLLAQLNREVEKTANKRPELSHLRDSGEIEQDADLVLLLFREAYYLATDPMLETDLGKQQRLEDVENKLEIIVAKQRMGPTGSVEVYCHPGASAVRDLARHA